MLLQVPRIPSPAMPLGLEEGCPKPRVGSEPTQALPALQNPAGPGEARVGCLDLAPGYTEEGVGRGGGKEP